MKHFFKYRWILAGLLFFCQLKGFSQKFGNVQYDIKYNPATNIFSAYAIPDFTTVSVQNFNVGQSVYTVVLDAGIVTSTGSISSSLVQGFRPFGLWSLAASDLDFRGKTYLNFVNANQQDHIVVAANTPVLLFTFQLPGVTCADHVRLFINGSDPYSDAVATDNPGPGTDSRNTFIQVGPGPAEQYFIYSDNKKNETPCYMTVSGNVWNDVNGNQTNDGEQMINGSNTGTGILPGVPLYANLLDAGGNVIATVPVKADGSYDFTKIDTVYTATNTTDPQYPIRTTYLTTGLVPTNTTGLQIQISTQPGVAGVNLPAGWASTGENVGAGNHAAQTPGTAGLGVIQLNTDSTTIVLQNFGIQQTPESAVSQVPAAVNPGGTTPVTVPDANWTTSTDPSADPNTTDYNGGTVQQIVITTFPSNATSITIDGVTYYPVGVTPPPGGVTFPAGGVTTAAPNGIPSTPISVDPMDGMVTVVIPFAAIDNAGAQDPTPGSVTINFTSILPISFSGFNGYADKCTAQLKWSTATESNSKQFEVEQSTDGINWHTNAIVKAAGYSNQKIDYTTALPIIGSTYNYFRIKELDIDGRSMLTGIIRLSCKNTADITIKAYPNPGFGFITVELPEAYKNADIIVFDNTGRKVMLTQLKGATTTRLDITALVPGTYILVADNSIEKKTLKFVKQKN